MAKGKPIITTECVDLLRKTLMENKAKQGDVSNEEVNIDSTDSGNLIAHLVDALCFLTQEIQRLKGCNPLVQHETDGATVTPKPALEERLRLAEDEVDEGRQRQLKGNLILSSSKRGQRSLIKTTQELNGKPLLEHINELLSQKYGVSVPDEDVQACHHLPNGSVVLRIWKRTENSAWTRLIQAIRSKPISAINFFANFHMTHRRNELLFQLRQLRREDKEGYNFKLFTDENGAISIKFPDSDLKYKLTYHRFKGKAMKTFTKTELVHLFASH